VQVCKIDKVLMKDSSSKLNSGKNAAKDKAFSKELDRAVKDKKIDKGSKKDSSEEEKVKAETSDTSKEVMPKEVKEEVKPQEEVKSSEKDDSKNTEKKVEDNLEIIMAMLNGAEIENPQKAEELLKNLKNGAEDLIKTGNVAQKLFGEKLLTLIEGNNENIDNKLKEIVSMMDKNVGGASLEAVMKSILTSNTVKGPDDGELAEKPIVKDKLEEKLEQILSSKLTKEGIKIPESLKSKVNELNGVKDQKNTTLDVKADLSKNELQQTKEDKLLKGLLSEDKGTDKKDALINKAANFTAQFNNIKEDNIAVEDTKMVISKNNIVQDVVKTVKFMQMKDLKQLTVKIAPKELGDVIIKLTMNNGVMKASITATNKEAYNLLNNNLSDINNKMNNTEIKINDFNFNFNSGDSTFFKDGSERQGEWQQNKKSDLSRILVDEEINVESVDNVDSNVNILA